MIFTATLLFIGQLLASTPPATAAPKPGQLSRTPATVVTGRVVNELETPLPGVVVTILGTPQVTSTNAAGDFLLSLTAMKSVLRFKCEGYREQTITVAADNPLTVKMYSLTKAAPANTITVSVPAVPEAGAAPAVLNFSEVLPSFPGGDVAYRNYMRQNAHFPKEAQEKAVSGTVYVGFVVDEQGRILNVELVKGCGHGFDQEALRLIRLMPWWTPGLMAGKPVAVSRILALPFVFREHE